MKLKDRILEICNDVCHKELSVDEQLIITGLLDSFKIMELICSLEEEFHIEFLPEEISELDNFSCVNHIINIVVKKKES